MKIAVLGATGRTGTLLVDELLRRGHTVTALVRTPEKLGANRDKINVVTGTSADPAALDQLLDGADAVISALGPTNKEPSLHTDTAKALILAMPRHQVTRFVGIGGAGVDVPGDLKCPKDKTISFLIQKLGGAVVADKPAEYGEFAASDLDWTLVRPPRLMDGPATGHVIHDAHTPGGSTIRRADLAAFLVDIVEANLYPRQAPFASQGKWAGNGQPERTAAHTWITATGEREHWASRIRTGTARRARRDQPGWRWDSSLRNRRKAPFPSNARLKSRPAARSLMPSAKSTLVDPVLTVDARVAGPEDHLAGPRIDQPSMLVVSLVRQRHGDLVNIDPGQVEPREARNALDRTS